MLPGERLVVPAGRTPQRGNGQEHRFRASSDYVYLTGDQSPEGVLVLDPDAGGHRAMLFVRPPSDPATVDFFQDYRHGELWVGRRPALSELEASSGIHCRPLGELAAALDASARTRVRRGLDVEVDALVEAGDPQTASSGPSSPSSGS
jgi:Xaa-Pro aminopeptidase